MISFACFQPIFTVIQNNCAKSDHFYLFSAYFDLFPPDLLMEYRIFILIVDISANLKNIDIDKEILENFAIDIDIDKEVLENIDNDIDIDKEILENIDIEIDIDKEISENIDIDKISNRLEFGISNSPMKGFTVKTLFSTLFISQFQL